MKKHKNILLLFIALIFSILAFNDARADNIFENTTHKDNQILVKFKNPNAGFLENFSKIYNLTYFPDKKIDKDNYYLFEIISDTPLTSLIKQIKSNPRVKKAQPNFIYQMARPNSARHQPERLVLAESHSDGDRMVRQAKKKSRQDPYFKRQWWILNDGSAGLAGADTSLSGLWPSEQKGWANEIIGIIDTGVFQKHADLKKNIVQGYDFVHGSKKDVLDKDGHGTFIAGLIAAEVNNKKGISGFSRTNRLKIMPLKFDFSTDQAVTAISYAQSRGVRIINTSWGTNEYDGALYEAIKNYSGLVVAAAGNESAEHNALNNFYPCDFDLDNILCVGASSENDAITSYSDWSPTMVDLLAPGGEGSPLISLGLKKNLYVEGEGTSYATAMVSGAAGLVLSANPTISNAEIKDLILQNVRKKEELADKVSSGGILNIKAAVNKENTIQ